MSAPYLAAKSALATYVLNSDAVKHAGLVLGGMLVTWYVLSLIINLSWSYALLVALGVIFKAYRFSHAAILVLAGYLVINFFVTVCFLLERMFLSKRYLIAFSLVLMVFVPFALAKLLSKAAGSQAKYRLLSLVVIVGMLFSAVGGMINFGYSKAYIREAGVWIDQYIPKHAALYTNDYQLMYYSKHFGDDLFKKNIAFASGAAIEGGRVAQYDYVALRLTKNTAPVWQAKITAIPGEAIQDFHNKRGDRVVIYKVRRG